MKQVGSKITKWHDLVAHNWERLFVHLGDTKPNELDRFIKWKQCFLYGNNLDN